jgi:type IV fimbrial biogenesis protein FimT
MHGCINHRRQGGTTLIEQIMVVAIVAALAGVAAPPMRALLTRNQVQSAQMDIMAALQYARGSAIESGARVVFCPTRDASRCSDEAQWGGGWLLAIDRDHDNQPDGAPLRVGPSYTHVTIQSTAGRRRVSFQPDGSAGGSNLTVLICQPGGGGSSLAVVISNSGRIRGAAATATQAAACASA